jgi:hypothetical protein
MRHFLLVLVPVLPSVAHADDRPAAPSVTVSWPDRPGVAAPVVAIATPPPEKRESLALSIDPVGLVTGAYAASATHVLGPHVAVRGDIQYTRELYMNIPNTSAWSASLGVPLYLDRPFHGPFAELGVVAGRSVDLGIAVAQDGMSSDWVSDPVKEIGLQGFVGWQWTFRSGLHLSYAIGASRSWSGNGQPSRVAGENAIRVGFAL